MIAKKAKVSYETVSRVLFPGLTFHPLLLPRSELLFEKYPSPQQESQYNSFVMSLINGFFRSVI